jgi:cell division protein FtsW
MELVRKQRGDFPLVLVVVLLLGVGIALLFSGSYSFSARAYQDPLRLVKRQLLFLAAGAVAAFVASLTPLDLVRRAMPALLLATLLFLLLPFVPGLGLRVLGSQRWVSVFGLSLQPSELVKVTLVLYLASYFARSEDRARGSLNALVPPFIVVCVFVALIYLQNDYSTAVFVLALGLATLFMAGTKLLHVVLVSLATLPLGFLLLFARAHRIERLLAFLDASADATGRGYQILAARSALVSGGIWGRGLGRGIAKLGALPMAHSDFIYAVIGEETGLLGALCVLALFGLLAWRGYQVSARAEDPFVSTAAFGLTTAIVLQAILNMAMAVGMVPTTGITLPFFSAGGSSLLVTMLMCGLLVNCSRRRDV